MIICGDCIEVMKTLPDNSVDSICTDPPYGIGFMGKEWDKFKQNRRAKSQIVNMGTGMAFPKRDKLVEYQEWCYLWAKECIRVLKPGGHMLSACGTRTYHRMVCGLEDAGFEIRDTIGWLYGQGFPKSHNIGKAVDKLQGNEREVIGITRGVGVEDNKGYGGIARGGVGIEQRGIDIALTRGYSDWEGWGTGLKPAMELWALCRKPISEKTIAKNVLKWGVGGINIDGCRVGSSGGTKHIDGEKEYENEIYGKGLYKDFGKPVENLGRFPANLIHDGSQIVMDLFPNTKGGTWNTTDGARPFNNDGADTGYETTKKSAPGSAARYFYCAKASKKERNMGLDYDPTDNSDKYNGKFPCSKADKCKTNKHPTVKPIKLMRYLCRLITPPGGTVLDPFAGSGTTGIACKLEGFDFILIEREPEYCEIASRRLGLKT